MRYYHLRAKQNRAGQTVCPVCGRTAESLPVLESMPCRNSDGRDSAKTLLVGTVSEPAMPAVGDLWIEEERTVWVWANRDGVEGWMSVSDESWRMGQLSLPGLGTNDEAVSVSVSVPNGGKESDDILMASMDLAMNSRNTVRVSDITATHQADGTVTLTALGMPLDIPSTNPWNGTRIHAVNP